MILSGMSLRRNDRTRLLTSLALLTLISIKGAVAFVQTNSLPPMPLAYAYVPSPNCDDRPAGTDINCIVLHSTVEPTTEGTEQIFLNRTTKVSAHFVVGKDGRVIQMVPIEKRAWHAGKSLLEGQTDVNNFSVGIEMVNLNDGKDPYPREQVEAVAGLIRFIRSRYNVPDSRIISHAAVAQPVGRKSDPAGFDFDEVEKLAGAPQSALSTAAPKPTVPKPEPAPPARKEREE